MNVEWRVANHQTTTKIILLRKSTFVIYAKSSGV